MTLIIATPCLGTSPTSLVVRTASRHRATRHLLTTIYSVLQLGEGSVAVRVCKLNVAASDFVLTLFPITRSHAPKINKYSFTFLQMTMSEQMCTLTISLLMLFLQLNYQSLFNSGMDNILIVKEILLHLYRWLFWEWCTTENDGTIFLTAPLVVKTQEVDNFNCTFSECAGENMVCYCSVPNDRLFWWGRNICITMINDSNPTRDDHNVVAEVVETSPSGEFTSKLTRRNISIGLNGTEIGCSRSTCNSSRASQNSSFTLNVQSCQGETQ